MSDGLSIRFIRSYDPEADKWSNRIHGVNMDTVFALARADERDVPFAVKMADAYTFIKSGVH